MKYNILIFLILLSGTYTTVLCVRNQEEPSALSSSSSDSSHTTGERGTEGHGAGHQAGKEAEKAQQLESTGTGVGGQGHGTQEHQQSLQVPDTESETKVQDPLKGPDGGVPKVEGDLKGPGSPDGPGKGPSQEVESPPRDSASSTQDGAGVGAGVKPPEVPKDTADLPESGSSSSKTTQEQESALAAKADPLKVPETRQQKQPEGPPTGQLPQASQQLPSTKTDQAINPLQPQPAQPPVVKNPEVPLPQPRLAENTLPDAPPATPPVTAPLESRTKEVAIKPVVNPTPKPTTDRAQTTTEAGQQANAQGTPGAGSGANATQENTEANKDNQVKEVLMSSLKEMQTDFDNVNSTEMVQPPADKADAAKKSLCESFKTDLVNVCTASGQNSSADLLTLVNNYYRNNVCMTEHSLNQLFNKDGEFAYKLLTSHLAQFSKKAPNKSTQDVYDKSVPVVTKLADLMKNAELALVSDKVKDLLEKRNLILTSALCAVANADQNVMASTQFESGQVTLTLNQEDYIKETTEAFMKAYAPMAELLKEFNTLMPKLLDIFEAGFENKINMLTSLANSRNTPAQPSVGAPAAGRAPGVSASGSAPASASTTTTGAGSGPSPPSTSNAATGPLPSAQATDGLTRQPAAAVLKTEATRPAATTTLTTGSTGSTGTRSTLLQFVGDDNREVAAVHGHPSLIQKFKSLLQVSTTPLAATGSGPSPTSPKDPAPTTPKEPAPTTHEASGQVLTGQNIVTGGSATQGSLPGGSTTQDSARNQLTNQGPGSANVAQGQGSENRPAGAAAAGLGQSSPGGAQPGVSGSQSAGGPQVDVTRLNGMELLNRTTQGGVVTTDHSQHQLATSGTNSVLAKLGLEAATRAETDALVTGTGPLGVLSQIKTKLAALVSRGNSGAQAPAKGAAPSEEAAKKLREVEEEQQLFDEAMKHFMNLGLFKTKGGKFVAELDEQKVKALVRANLLTLNDFDSLYNLVVGPQRSLHSLYAFMEHMLLSPDADEKIKHLEDSKLLERIKNMVSPLEDLYEQIKANVPKLTLRSPSLGADSELEAPARPSGEAAGEHVNRRGKFLLVSNSSGVNLSDHNLLIKLNKLIQNLSTRSGFKVGGDS
ncbi:conserved hypothetical protein [Theileria orientalis strain Shintoku]|uniref:Uncharacterized protein n=1 Tax=Theileria orientalis strain Shintoku TaxID=869250 RepID=J4DPR9_THEOR|nr:conserved hypothetical protein [Theileria orientalis strain Shintoku]BAM41184.1 conserved hypothetical protein [Theileria orientalis strain Shintoku]|eukprot:XP_009691485.1 conserved hypothetical protein [Theileria orientalis strain Shintoku]